ncbi:MAG TPA: amidohydrolase [Nitrososphaeria archaeon]|nr:amidohydrolase [Conexivisphaerales archaeon]HEU16758.1 amidohydrolase [Nitrososphaeria archaeon]
MRAKGGAGRTAFLAKFVLPEARGSWIKDAALLVEDGIIMHVGPREGLDMQGFEKVDLGNVAVIPGFVNAHAHVAMSLLRGYGDGLPLHAWLERIWRIEARMDQEVIYHGSLLGVAEQVRSGITSFVDFYNVEPMLRALRYLDLHVRAVLTLAFMDRVEYMVEESWRRLRSIGEYASMVREWDGGRLDLALGPHAPYSCSPEMLRDLAEASAKLKLRVHTHLSETEEDVAKVREESGMTPAAYLETLGLLNERLIAAHGVHLTDDEISLMGKRGASVVHCPRSNSRLGTGVARIREMMDAGVNVALGTDGPASSDSLDAFEEMRLMVYLQRARLGSPSAIGASDALHAMTLGSARAAGLDDVGALRPGLRADFVALDLGSIHMRPAWDLTTNVVMSAGRADVRYVYIEGKPAVEEGRMLLRGVEEAIASADEFRDLFRDAENAVR